MESQLDKEYDRQRRALVQQTTDAVEQAWLQRDWHDRNSFLDPGMQLVDGAATAYVTLQSAYFSARASAIGKTEVDHSVDPNLFTAEEIRPDEPQFLEQAYGTLITKLSAGKEFAVADQEAANYVRTLVKTHLQAIQVRGSWLWIATY